MSKEAFDRKLEALDVLRAEPAAPETLLKLRDALADRNNYIVSKASAISAQLQLRAIVPDLLTAFDRFLQNPVKSDPQCWAKNAIAKALVDLRHDDAAAFVKGLRHFQMEPVWGGQSDTAGTLRGTCSLALVNCRIDDLSVLEYLVEVLADPELPVRLDAARAIARLGAREGALLLRLKALLGNPEPEVIGQCFISLLNLDRSSGVAFIAKFLEGGRRDVQIEAACSLAQADLPEALAAIKYQWERWTDPELKRAIVLSLGGSPLTEGAEFLIHLIAEATVPIAVEAITALAASRYRAEFREPAAAIVARRNEASLTKAFQDAYPAD